MMQMGCVAPFQAMDVTGFGSGEHLLIWSWRRIATGGASCPSIMQTFADACGSDGPEVYITFCTFLKALGISSRRRLRIAAPGSLAITADERQVLTLLAAAQAGTPALLEAHLRWIARPDKRDILEIATSALATALSVNELRLAIPDAEMPTICERKLAIA